MSAPSIHSSRISVADLLKRPGASRSVDVELDVPEGLELPLVDSVGALHLQGVLESVVEGILVRGEVATRLAFPCARCLTPTGDDVVVDVAELYSDPAEAEDQDEIEAGYEIRDGVIDLEPMLRDALIPAAPLAPHCRDDCQGLCVTCGVNLNEVQDHGHEEEIDPRWQGLQGFRPQNGSPD